MEQPIANPNTDSETPPENAPAVITVSRITFNYIVIGVVCLLLGLVMGAVGYDRFAQANRQSTEALIDQAVAAAIAQQPQAAQGAQQPSLRPGERYEVTVADNPSIGPNEAPVQIIEFSDFRCGFCGRFARETLGTIIENYGDQVQFVYRDYVIFGQQSYEAALAAECAHDQDQFWPFHDWIFANQQTLGREQYITLATELDMDVEAFTTCYDEQTHRDEIIGDVTFGDELGITGTPAFFINGRFVSGAQPYEVFAQVIDEEIARAQNGDAPLESGA